MTIEERLSELERRVEALERPPEPPSLEEQHRMKVAVRAAAEKEK
jgi:hypothetical protein